ncbi:PIG-L family deacetylase, partial [Candidatus Poribacteria bacterium]
MRRLSVIAIGAHPDDVEILCAGTLAKLAKQGHKVTICYATDGQFGHVTIKPDELKEIRRREAEKACAVIGAEMIWLGYQDEFIFDSKETRLRFIEAIRKARADLIITHYPEDYHEDHRIVSRIATTAGFLA